MSLAAKVLFVCTGNTCRSPMAEGLFKKFVKDQGVASIEVLGSCGVATDDGYPMSTETATILDKADAALPAFESSVVRASLLEEATHVFAMTQDHLDLLLLNFPTYAEKCYLMRGLLPAHESLGNDIPDPIGWGEAAYEETACFIEEAMPTIIDLIDPSKKTS